MENHETLLCSCMSVKCHRCGAEASEENLTPIGIQKGWVAFADIAPKHIGFLHFCPTCITLARLACDYEHITLDAVYALDEPGD